MILRAVHLVMLFRVHKRFFDVWYSIRYNIWTSWEDDTNVPLINTFNQWQISIYKSQSSFWFGTGVNIQDAISDNMLENKYHITVRAARKKSNSHVYAHGRLCRALTRRFLARALYRPGCRSRSSPPGGVSGRYGGCPRPISSPLSRFPARYDEISGRDEGAEGRSSWTPATRKQGR